MTLIALGSERLACKIILLCIWYLKSPPRQPLATCAQVRLWKQYEVGIHSSVTFALRTVNNEHLFSVLTGRRVQIAHSEASPWSSKCTFFLLSLQLPHLSQILTTCCRHTADWPLLHVTSIWWHPRFQGLSRQRTRRDRVWRDIGVSSERFRLRSPMNLGTYIPEASQSDAASWYRYSSAQFVNSSAPRSPRKADQRNAAREVQDPYISESSESSEESENEEEVRRKVSSCYNSRATG